jgi:hypothetical protein
MSNKINFGIVISCYIGDYFLTKGLLASINTFMPLTPVCIIQDGEFSIEAERKIYNITHVIKRSDVKDEFLRDNCFGSRFTNMIAFWESPFDFFFYIDSDTVAWGDVTKHVDYWNYDFVHNTPHEEYTEFILHSQYFDYERLFGLIPQIDIHKHHFFNAGVFFAKRGIFDLELFKKLFFIWKNDKKLFGPEPQGLINYMVFSGVEKSKLNVSEAPIQKIVPVFKKEEIETMFHFDKKHPIVHEDIIIHWAGLKPLKINGNRVYNKAAFCFRRCNIRNRKSIWCLFPNIYMYYEEYVSLLYRYHKGSLRIYILKKIKRIFTK